MAQTAAALRKDLLASDGFDRGWLTADNTYGWWLVAKTVLPFFATVILLPHLVAAGYGWIAIPAAYVLLGVYGYKMTFILHETCHLSLFNTQKLNRLIGSLAGYVTGTNYEIFRDIHMLHHKCNGTEDDPQLEDFLGHEHPLTRRKIMHHITQRLYGGDVLSFLAHYFSFLPKSLRKDHRYQNNFKLPKNTAGFYVGVIAMQSAIALLITDFLTYWWLAFLYPFAAITLSLFLVRIRTCAEHMRPNHIAEKDFTRSHIPNGFDRFFLYDANFNYHFEHHIFPHLPACNLPRFSKAFGAQIHDNETLGHAMAKTVAHIVRIS